MSKLVLLALIAMLSLNALSDAGTPWEIKMVALDSGGTRHIKYNIYTGETWWSKNLVWEKIIEPYPISVSTYEFKVVSTGASWRTLRIDKLTGDAWKNSKGTWKKLSENTK